MSSIIHRPLVHNSSTPLDAKDLNYCSASIYNTMYVYVCVRVLVHATHLQNVRKWRNSG